MGDITQLADSDGNKITPAKEDGNLATIKDDLALIKADIDAIKTAIQIMDDWDDSDRAKAAQENRSTHWQIYMTGSGEIRAEEEGKIAVITDIIGVQYNASLDYQVREKDASGSILHRVYHTQNTVLPISLREGIEGASHDGAGAGSLYLVGTAISYVTITGYMRDA